MTEATGQCLCGAVKFVVANLNHRVDACHCGMCRRWGGGPLMTVSCGRDVEFDGAENITVYDSSDWAERGFCKHCGSHLFYRLKHNQEHELMAGLFDDQQSFRFDLQVFIDYKPSFYSFAEDTKKLTEAELLQSLGIDPDELPA